HNLATTPRGWLENAREMFNILGRRRALDDQGRFEMSEFSDSYILRVLLAPHTPTRASTRSLGGGAGCGPLCATRIGPSYTTCAGPEQNGARSTRGALGGRAGRTCDPPNTPLSKMRRETLAAEVIQLRLDRCASLDAILSVLRDTESA